MLKKIGYLFLIVMAISVLVYFWNGQEKSNFTSQLNPNSRITEGLIKKKPNGKSRVSEIIDKMTLDEKIGQLLFAGLNGTTIPKETIILINQYKVGGFIFFSNNLDHPKQSLKLLNQMKAENEQNRLPLFLGVDQEGGRVERLPDLMDLPTNQEIGIKNNEQFSYETGELLGMQLNAFGFNLNFAPVLDVNSNPNNPVIGDRSFSDDPDIVSKLGIQTMQGMKSQHIIPVVKHFPGHGDTEVDSHVELPLVNKSLKELQALELLPFKKAIEAGAETIMTAHILLPQIDDEYPASMSDKVITEILREQLAFDGVVITDDMTMQAITNHYHIGDAAVKSVKAGTDIILVAHHYDELVSVFNALKTAIEEGEITEERIDESVKRIVRLKLKYEISDEQIESIDVAPLNKLLEERSNE